MELGIFTAVLMGILGVVTVGCAVAMWFENRATEANYKHLAEVRRAALCDFIHDHEASGMACEGLNAAYITAKRATR